MKEIKEIIDIGRRLDELAYETYGIFAKRDDFDQPLVALWAGMAEWKKNHLKYWKKIAKTYVYKNIFHRSPEDLKVIVKQLKSIQTEHVEFMRRLRKKRINQSEAISQTILNEFCLVSDIFLEIFYTCDEMFKDPQFSCVEDCERQMMKMANVFRPYLKMNPLYAVLLKSIVELKHKYDLLLVRSGRMKKAAV